MHRRESLRPQHGINLTSIRIELDPDGFLGKNPDAKIGFSTITERFYIEADNTEEELEASLDFMETHCPVMDTLVNAPTFVRELHR
ncbi:OsmC family protein [Bowdeniella nasicola]|uniref:OsmC family protein n=1 Tax=Bowdeniella nasicola TaxID=208480 RepID=UPI001C9E33EF|nr:OsmC family protein [Bowdeniella nasicola]